MEVCHNKQHLTQFYNRSIAFYYVQFYVAYNSSSPVLGVLMLLISPIQEFFGFFHSFYNNFVN